MLNSQRWGGYLEWTAWPRHEVFLDGRIELHPAQVWLDYLDIVFPTTRWRALLDQYDISYMVLNMSTRRTWWRTYDSTLPGTSATRMIRGWCLPEL
jgi:hypothetical protein